MAQLSLCPVYAAANADYRVIELAGPAFERGARMQESTLPGWKQITRTTDYDAAAGAARNHCVLSGREVWVFDRNDEDQVVFRVCPDEYTARALALRGQQVAA